MRSFTIYFETLQPETMSIHKTEKKRTYMKSISVFQDGCHEVAFKLGVQLVNDEVD